MTDASPSSGAGVKFSEVAFDYNSEKSKRSSDKAPFFNGDSTSFPLWKTMMYSHIIGIDDEYEIWLKRVSRSRIWMTNE
jgi:hypothetical protein